MNSSLDQARKKLTLHPLISAATVAVILLCAVASAALLGWLPALMGGNHPSRPANASTLASVPDVSPPPEHLAPPVERLVTAPPKQVCGNCGVIKSVRTTTTRAEGSGVGAAGGAVLGGLLGKQIGGGTGRSVATVAGAIGGAVAGNQIEGQVNANHSYEIFVRLDTGATRTLHRNTPPPWNSGQRVRIVDGALRAD